MFKIAIDLMGGDYNSREPIKGIEHFVKSNPKKSIFFYLVGKEKDILENLDQNILDKNYKIIDTDEFVEMSDNPVKVIKQKPNSSMLIALKLLKEKKVNAMITCGNTGALILSSTVLIKKISGVKKVILAPKIPNKYGSFILADAGANINLNPLNFINMAELCSIYSSITNGNNNPSVHLLNIGHEESKGTPILVDAYQALSKKHPNFKGNLEPRYLMDKKIDILLCDGFVGNIVLKLTEGLSHYLLNILKEKSENRFIEDIKNLKNIFNYELSTILLGLNGIVLKCHGSSSYKSFTHAINEAEKMYKLRLINRINNFFKGIETK
tara:strand:+ start:327 stop:1301 length:975 start_codon:yes stop_codon:yes gene_type:complete